MKKAMMAMVLLAGGLLAAPHNRFGEAAVVNDGCAPHVVVQEAPHYDRDRVVDRGRMDRDRGGDRTNRTDRTDRGDGFRR